MISTQNNEEPEFLAKKTGPIALIVGRRYPLCAAELRFKISDLI